MRDSSSGLAYFWKLISLLQQGPNSCWTERRIKNPHNHLLEGWTKSVVRHNTTVLPKMCVCACVSLVREKPSCLGCFLASGRNRGELGLTWWVCLGSYRSEYTGRAGLFSWVETRWTLEQAVWTLSLEPEWIWGTSRFRSLCWVLFTNIPFHCPGNLSERWHQPLCRWGHLRSRRRRHRTGPEPGLVGLGVWEHGPWTVCSLGHGGVYVLRLLIC